MTSPFLGSSSSHSRQKLRGKAYLRLSRDVYLLLPAQATLRTRVEAVRLVLPDAVPCSVTAGLLQNLPVDDDGLLHVARQRQAARSRRDGVRVHRTPVEHDERLDVKGLPVADGPRVFVDLAAHLSLEALVAVGDVVLRRYSAKALEKAVARRSRRPGLPLARTALALLDPGSDSPAETRARLRLHAAGFGALRHGVVAWDEDGGWLGRFDLADEAAKVAVQYDGKVHWEKGRKQWDHDVQRDALSRRHGWDVVVATARDDQQPHLLVAKVEAAYRRAGALLGAQVLPPHLR